ncbi:hypothetical protein FOQG_05839 [Fusarium oxysporum f. sp. raphani 54005]|uniref:Uncharacterized protein n=2 Tax=Fusarium oxysporum TaxID=5507 RepID=X0CF61_FUSOX|nr:hypothetical protein FOVG_05154 [Fusarium oxysporum f. sp. pisi HDV247]EXK92826.1 hypothetical protein FOQG_05839 [Fusarium oxysporum f. sp. raphani 54005]
MDTITSFISMFVTQRQQSKPLPSPDINRYQARWAVSLKVLCIIYRSGLIPALIAIGSSSLLPIMPWSPALDFCFFGVEPVEVLALNRSKLSTNSDRDMSKTLE